MLWAVKLLPFAPTKYISVNKCMVARLCGITQSGLAPMAEVRIGVIIVCGTRIHLWIITHSCWYEKLFWELESWLEGKAGDHSDSVQVQVHGHVKCFLLLTCALRP